MKTIRVSNVVRGKDGSEHYRLYTFIPVTGPHGHLVWQECLIAEQIYYDRDQAEHQALSDDSDGVICYVPSVYSQRKVRTLELQAIIDWYSSHLHYDVDTITILAEISRIGVKRLEIR